MIPLELEGIWEGKDRIIFFENQEVLEDNEKSKCSLVLLLKNFYGWYYDRVSEPLSYGEKAKRSRNDATSRKGEIVDINIVAKAPYYEVNLTYSKLQKNTVPLLLFKDALYLDFYTRILPENNIKENVNYNDNYNGFWQGHGLSKGILMSEQSIPQEISSYYINDNEIYKIRYWITDMDYSSDYVELTYEDNTFFIPKHIKSAGNVYTCVRGRGKKVRNVFPPSNFNPDNYIFTEEKDFLIFNKIPYLVKMADYKTFNDYISLVNKANSRRKPKRKALFPPADVNWHWDLIDKLEENNEIIQKVRARQEAFAPRPRDLPQ